MFDNLSLNSILLSSFWGTSSNPCCLFSPSHQSIIQSIISPLPQQSSKMILQRSQKNFRFLNPVETLAFNLLDLSEEPPIFLKTFLLAFMTLFFFSILLDHYFWAHVFRLPPPEFNHQEIELFRAWAWILMSFSFICSSTVLFQLQWL